MLNIKIKLRGSKEKDKLSEIVLEFHHYRTERNVEACLTVKGLAKTNLRSRS